ncbi:hypothetical protein GCM10020229_72360 [Kitasatospora albolonga]
MPNGVSTAAYRSPPILASAAAAKYRIPMRTEPTVPGSVGSRTSWAASATEVTWASVVSRRRRTCAW